ncbi:hypothetical protein GCM10023085_69850 [Actinomadura viridis]
MERGDDRLPHLAGGLSQQVERPDDGVEFVRHLRTLTGPEAGNPWPQAGSCVDPPAARGRFSRGGQPEQGFPLPTTPFLTVTSPVPSA